MSMTALKRSVAAMLVLASAAPAIAGWRTVRVHDLSEGRTHTRTVNVDEPEKDRTKVWDPILSETPRYAAPVVVPAKRTTERDEDE
jgi:hypothetical protein